MLLVFIVHRQGLTPAYEMLFLLAGGSLLYNLHCALCGIGDDGLELILSRDHGGVFGAYTLEVYRVKLAFGGAHAAADALVGIDHTASAAKAAGGFSLDLLFGEGHALIAHGLYLGLVNAVLGTGGLAVALGRQNDLLLVKLGELAQIAVDGEGLTHVYKAVDGYGTLAAVCDGVDGPAFRRSARG